MSFKFACPHCGQRIGATLQDVGTTGGCPTCQQKFVVPAPVDSGPKTEAVPATVRAEIGQIPGVAKGNRAAATVAPVTKRGLAILAIVLAIFPGLNLVALVLAICAVVRSDRPGRRGERGVAVAAVTVASLLVLPTNVFTPLAVYPFVKSMRPFATQTAPAHDASPAPARPSPTPAKH